MNPQHERTGGIPAGPHAIAHAGSTRRRRKILNAARNGTPSKNGSLRFWSYCHLCAINWDKWERTASFRAACTPGDRTAVARCGHTILLRG